MSVLRNTGCGDFEANWASNEENILAVSRARDAAVDAGLPAVVRVINVNQFLSILNYDISVAHFELASRTDGWPKGLQARLAALLIVEFIDTVPHLIGTDLRATIEPFLQRDGNGEAFRMLSKRLSNLARSHRRELREIRNFALGHRDRDAVAQLAVIRSVKASIVHELLH